MATALSSQLKVKKDKIINELLDKRLVYSRTESEMKEENLSFIDYQLMETIKAKTLTDLEAIFKQPDVLGEPPPFIPDLKYGGGGWGTNRTGGYDFGTT